ncbi:MAG: hypothetical protein AB1553_00415 [Nitrospirota bacterium]
MWIDILRKEVAAKGPRMVARELGISRSTVDMVTQNKYQASTVKIEERVRKIYGRDGKVECPIKGLITPIECAENFKKAKAIGLKASNPETLRLYKTCKACSVRR